jgi:uncharacterized cupredoxin-like copper-binding protein
MFGGRVYSRFTRVIGLLVFLVVGVLPLYAQDSDHGHGHGSSGEATPITISLTEYAVLIEGQPANTPLHLEAGKAYELLLKNTGKDKHEVMLGSEPKQLNNTFWHGYKTDFLKDVELTLSSKLHDQELTVVALGLRSVVISPGQTLAVNFKLPADRVGDWELGCFLFLQPTADMDHPGPSHFDAGMKLPLHVTSPKS